MTKLICIVGMPGSGKSTVGNIFAQHGFYFIRFGQLTLDIVKERGLEPTEENERKVREELRAKHGMGAYAKLNLPKIDSLLQERDVAVDGLYSWSEYKILKQQFGNQMVVLALYAPPQIRYQRLEARKEIDEKMINRPITAKKAQARDYAEIETIEKGGPIAMADYTILNIGSSEELIENVKNIIALITSSA